MVEVKIPYVVRRGNSWRYRRRPPPDVLDKLLDGKGSWIETWRPGTPLAEVEYEARKLCARHDQEINIARGDVEATQIADAEVAAKRILRQETPGDAAWFLSFLHEYPDENAALINTLQNRGTYRPETFALTKALERDRNLHSGDTDMRPFHYSVKSFVDLIGDKDVTRITRADVSEWLAGQRREGLAPATVRRRFGTLKALVNRALLDLDHPGRNPFDGHKVGGKGSTSDRLPLNKAMLDLLDAYLGSGRAGHETVSILRIMKGTGGGPAEIGGLAVADLNLVSEVPYLWIRHNALRRIKASVRDRQLPLVGDALTAAQDALERAQERTRGENRDKAGLFPSFDLAGRAADSISAKLNKAIRAAGIPRSPRLTAYSLRHTLKEAMRSAGVLDHIQRRVLGHAGHGVADTYGSPRARLSEAKTALVAAMECLGDVDDSIYSERERL